MLPTAFIKGYDQRRLRTLLTVLFLALAIPTGAVIWQAYDQLKWEAWYQYRNQAEELTNRIDLAIGQRVEAVGCVHGNILDANVRIVQHVFHFIDHAQAEIDGIANEFVIPVDKRHGWFICAISNANLLGFLNLFQGREVCRQGDA